MEELGKIASPRKSIQPPEPPMFGLPEESLPPDFETLIQIWLDSDKPISPHVEKQALDFGAAAPAFFLSHRDEAEVLWTDAELSELRLDEPELDVEAEWKRCKY